MQKTITIQDGQGGGERELPLENIVYGAIIGHLEELELKRVYLGNGHHLAQRLTTMVADALIQRAGQQRPPPPPDTTAAAPDPSAGPAPGSAPGSAQSS